MGPAPRAALVLGRDGNFYGTSLAIMAVQWAWGLASVTKLDLLRRCVYLRLGGVRAAIPPDVSRMAARGGEQVR